MVIGIDMKSSKQFIVYHANCMDGFTSMFFALKALPDAETVPASHGKWDITADMFGAEVYFVDFCPTVEQLWRLLNGGSKVWVLDHHETAFVHLRDIEHKNLVKVFDQHHSGAGITYKYFVGTHLSLLAKYVEDRDLFKNILPHTDEISMYIMGSPFTIEAWEKLEKELDNDFEHCIAVGTALLGNKHKEMGIMLQSQYFVRFEGHIIPCINTSVNQSDLCTALYTEHKSSPFAVAWAFNGKQYKVSLRAGKDEVNLAELAEKYGGGGRRRAAGMRVEKLPWTIYDAKKLEILAD